VPIQSVMNTLPNAMNAAISFKVVAQQHVQLTRANAHTMAQAIT